MSEILEEAYRRDIITKGSGGYYREFIDSEPHDKKNIRILDDGTKCEWRGAANWQAYLDAHPEYFAYIKTRVEEYTSSAVQSLDSSTIALLEEENNISEDELIEEVNDILSTNEGE